MKILFTICGRAGSKGIKNKNLRTFCGKPLAYFTISVIDLYLKKHPEVEATTVVNSDSKELLKLVSNNGLLMVDIIERDISLAGDVIGKIAVIKDCMEKMEKKYQTSYDAVVDLDITSPLRTLSDLEAVINKHTETGADVTSTVAPARRNPYFNQVKKTNHGFKKVIESEFTARQQAPEIFDMNASIYAYKPEYLRSGKGVLDGYVEMVEMYDTAVLDLDHENDFELMETVAEHLFETKPEFRAVFDNAPAREFDDLNDVFPSSYRDENNNAIYVLTKEDKEMIVEHKKFYAEFFYFGNKLLDECFPSPIQDYELTIYSAYYRILELLDTLEVMTENSLINSGFLIVRSLLECAAQLCYVLCDDNQIEKRAIIWQMMDIKHSTEDPDSNVKAAKETEFYRRMENTNCYKGFVDIIKNSRTWPNWYSYCEGKRTGITDVFTIAGLQDLHDTLYSALCRENHEVNHMETNIEIRLDDEKKFHFKPFRVFYENHVLLMDCIIRSLLPVNKMMIDRYGDAKLKSEWQAYEAKSIEYVGSNKKLAEEIDKYLNPNHKWF